ncbi:MAG TPA: Plug domain-containing protein, partial [Steroidobacteraceae bacterium]
MDAADPRLEGCIEPLYDPIRGTTSSAVTQTPVTQNSAHAQIETATPLITISGDALQARGFSTVAEALKQSSVATGGVQGAQTSGSFTQGAETLSLFGMPPGFTKYLIDGRPMGNFPALYNGRDVFNNLSGIPMQLVDRIEILPGAQ